MDLVEQAVDALAALQRYGLKRGIATLCIGGGEATAVASIEKKLTSHFNARVSLKHSPKKGKIVIEYQGNTDLQRILDRLGVNV